MGSWSFLIFCDPTNCPLCQKRASATPVMTSGYNRISTFCLGMTRGTCKVIPFKDILRYESTTRSNRKQKMSLTDWNGGLTLNSRNNDFFSCNALWNRIIGISPIVAWTRRVLYSCTSFWSTASAPSIVVIPSRTHVRIRWSCSHWYERSTFPLACGDNA